MKCDRCGKNEATFYYKSNINGRVTETHLCPDCARAMGYAGSMSSRMSSWFNDDWFDRSVCWSRSSAALAAGC